MIHVPLNLLFFLPHGIKSIFEVGQALTNHAGGELSDCPSPADGLASMLGLGAWWGFRSREALSFLSMGSRL